MYYFLELITIISALSFRLSEIFLPANADRIFLLKKLFKILCCPVKRLSCQYKLPANHQLYLLHRYSHPNRHHIKFFCRHIEWRAEL